MTTVMRLNFLTFLTVSLVSLNSFCQYNAINNKQIILSGKVINPTDTAFANFLSGYIDEPGYSEQIRFTTPIDSFGNFKTTIQVRFSHQIGIIYNDKNTEVIVHPGDSIFMTINKKAYGRPDYIKFSGNAAELNALRYIYSLGIDSIMPVWSEISKREVSNTPKQFKDFSDSIHYELLKYNSNFKKQFKPDNELSIWMDMEVLNKYIYYLLGYPDNHCRSNGILYKDLDLGNSYFNFIDSIPKLKPAYLIHTFISSDLANYYLGRYVRWKVDEKINWNFDLPERDSLLINGILKYSQHDALLRQMLLNEFFNWQFETMDTVFYVKNLPILRKYVHEPFLIEPLDSKFNELKNNFLNPILASNNIIKNIKNSNVVSLLDSLKNNNIGKVIYVDIWATWCGPCRSQMPYSKELHQKFINKDVVFVYLCIDSDNDKWKTYLSQMQLPGVHFFLDKKTSANLRSDLKISGIPHYLLIDKKGDIIGNSDLWPGNVDTEKKINKLLNDTK